MDVADVSMHFRRLAEQDVHWHVDRLVAVLRIDDLQLTLFGCGADHGKQAALAFAQVFKLRQAIRLNRQHITFLRFIAPDFFRCHAAFFQRDCAQVKNRAAFGIVGDFREGIRQTACTYVMYRQNRIVILHRPACIDDFLRAPFHLWIAALYRVKIQISGIRAGRHRRSGAAAHAYAHAWTAELNQQAADWQIILLGVLGRDAADTTCNHDRLVIAID